MDDARISRDEVMKRAAFWLNNRQIHYNQSGVAKNILGNQYRTDCSGFVSMAFAIRDNPNTVSFVPTYLSEISFKELKPGDVLGVLGEGTGGDNGHITLFVKWDDAARTTVTVWEHGGDPDFPNEEHHVLSEWTHTGSNGTFAYKPYRYKHIVDDPGPEPRTGVAVVKDGTAYHVFIVGPDGNASQRFWDGFWRPKENLGGVVSGTPAAVCAPGLDWVELYGVGTDDMLRQHTYAGMWLEWERIPGGQVLGGVSAVKADDGARHLVAVNGAGTIYHRINRGSWGDWESLGGTAHDTPALLYRHAEADRYDLFVTDSHSQVVQRTYLNGIWHHWQGTTAGAVRAGVAACRDAGGALHIFARAEDRTLRHAVYNGQWNPWESFAGELSCLPAVVADGNRIDLFGLDADGNLVQKVLLDHHWHDWRRV